MQRQCHKSSWIAAMLPLHRAVLTALSECDRPHSCVVLFAAMKLLENSSFEALSSRLCVETGDSRILGR